MFVANSRTPLGSVGQWKQTSPTVLQVDTPDPVPSRAAPTHQPQTAVAGTVATVAFAAASRSRKRSRRPVGASISARLTAVRDDAAVLPLETDDAGRERLQYLPEGWLRWEWQPEASEEVDGALSSSGPFDCHYIVSGPVGGTPVVLVHGFGASSYHWRYQVPALASSGYRVYALCLLGYGWSPRKVLRYSGEVWASQINAFLRDVVKEPAVLAGNSVGAFASLIAAALEPNRCRGLALLNAAGRFEERQPGAGGLAKKQVGDVVAEAAEKAEPGPVQWVLEQIGRAIAGWAFWTTKLRIQPILEWVYVNGSQVDEQLVTSIRTPADHPDALDTFGQVIQAGRRTEITVFEALDKLPVSMPVLLLWGMQDPWMRPERAAAIRSECGERGISCEYVEIDAGHCPQDDAPDIVNDSMVAWMKTNGFAPSAAVDEANVLVTA